MIGRTQFDIVQKVCVLHGELQDESVLDTSESSLGSMCL